MSAPWRRRHESGGLSSLAVSALALDATDETSEPIVGWMVKVPHTVLGAGHVCIGCRPVRPVGMDPVYRVQLAAREKCRLCQGVLEAAREIGVR